MIRRQINTKKHSNDFISAITKWLPPKIYILKEEFIGGFKEAVRNVRPRLLVHFFQFHIVFGKKCQNNRLMFPTLGLASPVWEIPGSATERYSAYPLRLGDSNQSFLHVWVSWKTETNCRRSSTQESGLSVKPIQCIITGFVKYSFKILPYHFSKGNERWSELLWNIQKHWSLNLVLNPQIWSRPLILHCKHSTPNKEKLQFSRSKSTILHVERTFLSCCNSLMSRSESWQTWCFGYN